MRDPSPRRPPAALGLGDSALIAASFVFAFAKVVLAAPPPAEGVVPFRDAKRIPQEYVGPGRDDPSVVGPQLIVGWFGPSDPAHIDGGEAWRGASLAVDDINAAGGIGGRLAHLVARWADDPWRSGAANASRLVYEDGALALLGSLDGAATHLAEQVAVKARIPLLSPLSTDPSINLAGVPWMLSCLPGDDRIAPLLADAAVADSNPGSLALIVGTDHDSRMAGAEIRKVCSSRGLALSKILEIESETPPDNAIQGTANDRPRAVFVVAPSRTAGRVVLALRAHGFTGTVLGSAPLGRRAFLLEAGSAAEGVIIPCLHEPGPNWDAFASRWKVRFGYEPDETAAESYDAVRMVGAALGRSGPNRALLLDALRAMTPWTGIMGLHTWDNLGRNQRPIRLAAWRGGKPVPVD